MKTAEFEIRQKEMSDATLIELATKEICELASTYGKSHKMTIPPMITDTDVLLLEVVRRFKELSNAMQSGIKAKALRKKGTDKWYHADDMQEQVYLKDIPQIWGDTITTKGMIEFATELPLPADAELISIIILEGGEG